MLGTIPITTRYYIRCGDVDTVALGTMTRCCPLTHLHCTHGFACF